MPEAQLRAFYHTLFRAWGRQHWWPARTRFQVIVGAYLTQNTAWSNVELALGKLRQARLLSLDGIRRTPLPRLQRLIRSAGYFRQKARSLKTLVSFLDARYGGSLAGMFSRPSEELRQELLGLHGVGPETADSILLYAGGHPVFVVDAYTRRILHRHGIVPLSARYEEIRQLLQRALAEVKWEPALARRHAPSPASPLAAQRVSSHPPSPISTARRTPRAQVYNEMHGLIVNVGKNYCRKSKPLCDHCPLRPFLPK